MGCNFAVNGKILSAKIFGVRVHIVKGSVLLVKRRRCKRRFFRTKKTGALSRRRDESAIPQSHPRSRVNARE